MNIAALIVSCIALNFLGMFWYSPSGFGKQWMELVGIKWPTDKKKQEEMKKKAQKTMGRNILLSVAGNLVTGIVLSMLMMYTGMMSLKGGLMLAFMAWLGFGITRLALSSTLWEGRPWRLYVINMSYELVALLIMGGILGAWQ